MFYESTATQICVNNVAGFWEPRSVGVDLCRGITASKSVCGSTRHQAQERVSFVEPNFLKWPNLLNPIQDILLPTVLLFHKNVVHITLQ